MIGGNLPFYLVVAWMQEETETGAIRRELLERLRALDGPEIGGMLADLAYERGNEAIERALNEARKIRSQAIEDAKATRERELTSLMEAMRALRESAETRIEGALTAAEAEAERLRDRARREAQATLETATKEAAALRAEAESLRAAAQERLREIDSLEGEFNAVVSRMGKRIGIAPPAEGWWRRLLRRK